MKVLIACEFSGRVRDAFIAAGHDAISCDLLPTEQPGPHIQGNVKEVLGQAWDIMIAFPPCTYLACSGARWFKEREQQQESALRFVSDLMSAPIPAIAIENPIGVISTRIRKPDQIVEPYFFGDPYTKATCLWLTGLGPLRPTNPVQPRLYSPIHYASMRDRSRFRSRTPPGLALAMAQQWRAPL